MDRIPLRKSLGQHHLVDPGVCREMVDFLGPEGARVLEIGPGGGVLTGLLIERGARVWACELDFQWAFELRRRLGGPDLRVAMVDALDLRWGRLPEGCLVTGNLPFNVATPLIERLLLGAITLPKAAFLVQKEVADRLVAAPGDSDYGAMSVLVAARARPRRLGHVPARLFRPPPKVDGEFVGFEWVEPAIAREQLPALLKTVRAAFRQRRKTLRNSLAASWGRQKADEAIAALDLDPHTRAESWALEEFVRLHEWASSCA